MNQFQFLGTTSNTFRRVEALRRSLFVATNPTVGTGIASKNAPTSFSATAGLMNIYNAAAVGSGESEWIMPVCLRLMATTANTSATDFRLVFYRDDTNRYSSGGSAITEVFAAEYADVNSTDRTSQATIHFGDLTLAAASNAALLAAPLVCKTVLAANDIIEVWFGGASAANAQSASNAHMERTQVVVPPMWIGPGGNLSIHEVAGSQAADPAFEFEFWYVEHPPTDVTS